MYIYINHVNSNYIQIIYILCTKMYKIYQNIISYNFDSLLSIDFAWPIWKISPEAREASASTLSSFAPPALETLSPDKIIETLTKSWQNRDNVSTKLNSHIFLKHLETLWDARRFLLTNRNMLKHVETCWNMLKLSLVVTHAQWKCRLSPEASGFRSFQVKVQPESSTHARLRVQVHPVFERQELQLTCVGVLRWRETQTKKN